MPPYIPQSVQSPVGTRGSAGPPPEAPGWMDLIGAGFRTGLDEEKPVQLSRRSDSYKALADALEEMGVPRARLMSSGSGLAAPVFDPLAPAISYSGPVTALDEEKVWREAQRLRAAGRGFADLGESREQWEQKVLRRNGGRDADQAVLARGQGMAGTVAPIIGGAGAGFADPVNLALLPYGAGAGSLARVMLTEGLVGMGAEALQTPDMIAARSKLGEETSAGDVALNVVAAGVGGAVLGGGMELGGRALARLKPHLPERLRGKVRSVKDIPDIDLADAAEAAIGRESMTEAERGALTVLRREADIAASNPFEPDGAGLQAHREGLQWGIDQLLGDGPPRPAPPRLAAVAAGRSGGRAGVTGPPLTPPASGRGIGYDPAAVKALIRGPESAGDDRATNAMGSSAAGRYQFTRGTFKGVWRKVHGGSEADAEKAWQNQRFDGDVQEQLMDRLLADNAATLRAAGAPVDNGNLYVMHVLGSGDGPKLLRADPGRPVAELLSAEVVRQNPTYFGKGRTVGEALAVIRGKVGGSGSGGGSGSAGGVDALELEAMRAGDAQAAARQALAEDMPSLIDEDMPTLRPEVRQQMLVSDLRARLADRSLDLASPRKLSKGLGVEEGELRAALDQMVGAGDLRLTASGNYRRPVRGGTSGPDDMLRFIAKRGGLALDGLNDLGRKSGAQGHDLANSGNLKYFVPGGGPLLRKTGMALDDMAELLHDAGYFGPPAVTPRPTETELITLLDDVIRRKEKRFSSFDQAPEVRVSADDLRAPREETLAADDDHYDYWDAVAEKAATKTFFRHEVAAIERIAREGTDLLPPIDPAARPAPEELAPYVHEMINREIDDVLEAAFAEIEDPHYDAFPADLEPETGAAEGGFGRQAADAGSERAGAAGDGAGGDTAGPALADLPPEERTLFLDPAGPEARAMTDSLEHDARLAAMRTVPGQRSGDFIEFYDDDARAVANVLDIAITSRNGRPMAGIPVHAFEQYSEKLAEAGLRATDGTLPDPAIAARQAQEAALGAQAPLRGANKTGVEQDGTMGAPLFDAVDAPGFRFDAEGPEQSLRDLLDDLDAEQAEIKAAKDCL